MSHKTERRTEVLVVGGGMAGCAAALAARRAGAQVILAERSGVLGGCTTLCLVQPWQSFHAPPGRGGLPRQVIGGLAQEFVDDLLTLQATRGHVPDPIGFATTLTPVNSAVVAPYLATKLQDAGIELYLQREALWAGCSGSVMSTVTLDADPREPAQNLRIGARAFVDATGCALLPRLLGSEVIRPDPPQAWTHIFTLAGVDTQEIISYLEQHEEDFYLAADWRRRLKTYFAVSGFSSLVKEARERGEFPCPRDRLLLFGGFREGEVYVNTTRVLPPERYFRQPDTKKLRAAALLRAEGLRQVHALAKWLRRNAPGFRHAELAQVAPEIGVRESFRFRGQYILRGDDVLTGAQFPDAAATVYYPVDIHRTQDAGLDYILPARPYQIPLRALQSRQFSNLFAAGRCVSADGVAFASARVTPAAIALGEAAGRAAAESL